MEILLEVPFSRRVRDRQLALFIVSLDEVLDNGTGLPERETSVRVYNRRDSAVGVNGSKPFCLGVIHNDLIRSVRNRCGQN